MSSAQVAKALRVRGLTGWCRKAHFPRNEAKEDGRFSAGQDLLSRVAVKIPTDERGGQGGLTILGAEHHRRVEQLDGPVCARREVGRD